MEAEMEISHEMKELFKKKLDAVEDLEQRRALKELIEKVLLPMAEYQEEKWAEVIERVVDEVRPKEEPREIVMGLCKKEEYDPVHSYLFPILPPDTLELSGIESALQENAAPVPLFSVYINQTWEKTLEILSDPPVFDANLRTNDGRQVNGVCRLVPDERYKDVLRDLYRSFTKSGLAWETVCTAYIDRMVRVELTEWETFSEDMTLAEINVKFGDFSQVFLTDMTPLWNIVRSEMKSVNFAVPLENGLLFEHKVGIDESESEHGYLVNTSDETVQSVRRERTRLVITANTKKSRVWDVYKIVRPQELRMDAGLSYPLFSNRRRLEFVDMLADRTRNLFTYAEAMRIVGAYFLPLRARDLKVTEDETYPPHTYGTMNFGLDDAFSCISAEKSLCMYFETEAESAYTQDMIRFLMSELQARFPVFRCVGVLAE
jgi:hypothetical protein